VGGFAGVFVAGIRDSVGLTVSVRVSLGAGATVGAGAPPQEVINRDRIRIITIL